MEEPEETIEVPTVRSVLEDEEIRKILVVPRNIPRSVRDEIAEIVAFEIVTGERYDIKDVKKFMGRYGAFYLIFLALKNSEEWEGLIELAQKSQSIPVLALRAILPNIFDMIEEFSRFEPDLQKAIDEDMQRLLEEFRKLVEKTMQLWGRRMPEEMPKAFTHPTDLAEFFRDIRFLSEEALTNHFKDEDMEEFLFQLGHGPQALKSFSDLLQEKAEALAQDKKLDEKKKKDLQRSLLDSSGRFAEANKELKKRYVLIADLDRKGPGKDLEMEMKHLKAMLSDIIDELKDLAEEMSNIFEEPSYTSMFGLHMDVKRFQEMEKSQGFMSTLMRTALLPEISDFIERMEESVDLLNVLSMLFPGRSWDFMLGELHKTFLGNLERYSKILEKNEDIRKILELMGRIELEYGSRRIALSRFSTSEIYSVETSKNIQHVLPVELVKLQDETLKTLFFSNWLEGNLLTYQFRGKGWIGGPPKKKRKGPVVALVDTSGSMSGSPETVAKAIIFTIVKKMLKEKRDVKVILFSSTDQTDEIELTSMKKMAEEFLEFLSYSFGGGTDFNTALEAGLKSLKAKKFSGADILFITDGLSVVSDKSLIKKWNEFKDEKDSRIFTLIVGNDKAGGLEDLSDHTYILAEGERWHIDSSPVDIIKLISSA